LAVRAADLFAPNPTPPPPEEVLTLADLPALMGVAQPKTAEDAVTHVLAMQSALGDLSEDAVARRLSIGPRTLQRNLKDEGTSFREIRTRFVTDRARALLLESDLAIDEIALAVGYREPNSFRRAFRNWTGLSPSAYRAISRAA
jgi:AraC-like DNA-binding protein